VLRIAISTVAFFGTFFLVRLLADDTTVAVTGYAAGAMAFLALIIPNFVLDRLGTKQEERYRRSFPDFMDILIVCADAGLSLEAGVARVAKEMLMTSREFGIHLNIMMLEIRAGKRLREALTSFADRLALDEARSLATVFKQTEELGSSMIDTLRVFSHEMRRTRIVKAEEKANKLPVKMIFPLGLFIFPVMLIVIIFPVMLTLIKIIGQNMPN
jgi:tight adherence protein C